MGPRRPARRRSASRTAGSAREIAANGVKLDVPYGRDPELGLMSATLTDPWGATIRLTEGLNKIAGVTPYSYIDGYVVARPIE